MGSPALISWLLKRNMTKGEKTEQFISQNSIYTFVLEIKDN